MSNYRRGLNEAINLTNANGGIITVSQMVATFEQTKEGLNNFYPKRQVPDDGIHTKPLNL